MGGTEIIGEGSMHLPAYMGLIGSVGGIPVAEVPYLAFDEMVISLDHRKVLVGEVAHFRYRLEQLRLNDECRARATAHIQTSARRILDEPWKVSE